MGPVRQDQFPVMLFVREDARFGSKSEKNAISESRLKSGMLWFLFFAYRLMPFKNPTLNVWFDFRLFLTRLKNE